MFKELRERIMIITQWIENSVEMEIILKIENQMEIL